MSIEWLPPNNMPTHRPFLAWVEGFGPVTVSWDPNPPKGNHWKAVSLEAWFGDVWIVAWCERDLGQPAPHLFIEQYERLCRYVDTGEEPASLATKEPEADEESVEPIEDPKLAALIWASWREVNAIRAESGAPLGIDGMTRCTYEYWESLCEALGDALGDEERKPWPSGRMKPHVPRAKEPKA